MRRFVELWNRLRDRFRRDALSAELDEELRFHRARLEQDGFASSQLGNVTHIKEETRAMWSLGWLDELVFDMRYASRVLRRDATVTSAIVLTLALGIGANCALFAVVNAVLLRPLPYSDPARLVALWTAPVGSPSDRNPVSFPELNDWARQSRSFESMGAITFNRYELSGPEGAELARAAIGTRDLSTVLGARPVLGRLPAPADERVRVVTISHRLWLSRYGGSPSVIGRSVDLNEQPFMIIGVMPPGFHYPTPDIDLWTSFSPILDDPARAANNPWITSRSTRAYRVVARLRQGVTPAAAEAEMNEIERHLGVLYPDDRARRVVVQSVSDDALRTVRRPLWIMLAGTALLLLLACVNVAHLTLARAVARHRELAVRRALGAGRGRVLRQLLTESALLGLLGGAAGLVVARFATEMFIRLSPADVPRLETVHIDGTTLLFALAISVATSIAFGLAPAMIAWRSDVSTPLREQGRGSAGASGARLRAVLTTIEVAFTMVLLIGGGLMARSFVALLATDLGIRAHDVTTFALGLPTVRYSNDRARVDAVDRLVERLRTLPGVVAIGASTSLPPMRIQQTGGFDIEGQAPSEPGHQPSAVFIPATPDFTTALGIPLERGRLFDAHDVAGSEPVAIVTAGVMTQDFTTSNPIGQRIQIDGTSRRIVGVVGDAVYQGIAEPAIPQVYVPFAQSSFPGLWFALHASNAASLASSIRDAIHAVDPRLDPRQVRSMDDVIGEAVVRPRFQAWLLGAFGLLALALAATGIYGIVAYGVTRRTPELGMRAALGASRGSILALVLRDAMLPVSIGVVVGLLLASLGMRGLASLLYGVKSLDVGTYVAVSCVLLLVAATASIIPARRASRIDPMIALRN